MTAQNFSYSHDLEIIREVGLSPEQLFDGWTNPETLPHWFCPRPWRVVECEINLRPGGIFATTMQGPDGISMPRGEGCWLVVEPPGRLVWTNMMGADFQPKQNPPPGFDFVCELQFNILENGRTQYHARAMHKDAMSKAQHEAMGFTLGWSTALDQLIELKRLRKE